MCTGGTRRSSTHLGAAFWALVVLRAAFSLDSASTSAGMRSFYAAMPGRRALFIACLAIVALSLQGCDYDVPVHKVGNWRAQPDYLVAHEYIPPGGSAKAASLNSCSLERLSQTLQCSGRGTCKMWAPQKLDNTLSFCECDRDWADPECRTKRKSQTVAYALSMFLGMFGADHFYLGFHGTGIAKLLTLGGGGVWWVIDIIRIGSAPVPTGSFRTAADLPHYAFVLTCVMFSVILGFGVAYILTVTYRRRKRKEAMLLQQDEDNRQLESKPFADAYKTSMKGNRPVIAGLPGGYGAMPMSMGTMGPPMAMGPMASMRMP